jgi:hypothetical protein
MGPVASIAQPHYQGQIDPLLSSRILKKPIKIQHFPSNETQKMTTNSVLASADVTKDPSKIEIPSLPIAPATHSKPWITQNVLSNNLPQSHQASSLPKPLLDSSSQTHLIQMHSFSSQTELIAVLQRSIHSQTTDILHSQAKQMIDSCTNTPVVSTKEIYSMTTPVLQSHQNIQVQSLLQDASVNTLAVSVQSMGISTIETFFTHQSTQTLDHQMLIGSSQTDLISHASVDCMTEEHQEVEEEEAFSESEFQDDPIVIMLKDKMNRYREQLKIVEELQDQILERIEGD